MANILEKAQTLISANLHSILDKALKANSLAVLDEYIRQAQDNLDDLEDAAATVGGQVKTLKRKAEEFEKREQKLDRDIDMLLQRGKEDLAIAAQRRINNVQEMAQEYREQWEQQQKEYQTLLDARLKLEAKLTEIRQEREQLQALLELAKAKEVTTKTLRSLDDLAGVGDADIARIAATPDLDWDWLWDWSWDWGRDWDEDWGHSDFGFDLAAFFDTGMVWADKDAEIDLDQLKSSAGIGIFLGSVSMLRETG